ncbi:MAG: type II toxin-antitoxin system RelE/ParE family toxin [Chitinophagaceae bacterium]|jgi:toxin YoeB|nr:MAG: type II toxin-antitoxin system RelE/ParE family toxin [Chitinophagaceae bacterium]
MVKKVIWSSRAKSDLKEILKYWIKRNKSITYSLKLNALIEEQLDLITKFPTVGRKTDVPNVYVKIIKDYLLYYEREADSLHVLTIRDSRRNPKDFKIK